MIFETIERAKPRKNTVTSDFDNGATLFAHRRGHGVDHRFDAQHGGLSVDGADGLGRSLDIGEEDGGDLTRGLGSGLPHAPGLQGRATFATKFARRTGQSAARAVHPRSWRHFCRYRVTRVWLVASSIG